MKHCLVADDSAVTRKVARRILENLFYRVSEAQDGEQALRVCEAEMPDAILVDGHMPVMDGYEFLKRLREMPGGGRPNVVFCLLENDPAQVARAVHAGAQDCVLKPFDAEVLREKFSPADRA